MLSDSHSLVSESIRLPKIRMNIIIIIIQLQVGRAEARVLAELLIVKLCDFPTAANASSKTTQVGIVIAGFLHHYTHSMFISPFSHIFL